MAAARHCAKPIHPTRMGSNGLRVAAKGTQRQTMRPTLIAANLNRGERKCLNSDADVRAKRTTVCPRITCVRLPSDRDRGACLSKTRRGLCAPRSCAAPCFTRNLLRSERPADAPPLYRNWCRQNGGPPRMGSPVADHRNALLEEPVSSRRCARPKAVGRRLKRPAAACPKTVGRAAFKLYDTYASQFDLTQDACANRRKGLDIWTAQCCRWMRKRPKHAAAWSGSAEAADATVCSTRREIPGTTTFWAMTTENRRRQIAALIQTGASPESNR